MNPRSKFVKSFRVFFIEEIEYREHPTLSHLTWILKPNVVDSCTLSTTSASAGCAATMDKIILGILMLNRMTAYEIKNVIKLSYKSICSDSLGSIQAALKKLFDFPDEYGIAA